jgi:hypothetical protein
MFGKKKAFLEGLFYLCDQSCLCFRSNDVTLANKMESTGKPGMVHISERTYSFLQNEYFVQEGSPVGSNFTDCLILQNDLPFEIF